MELTGEPRALLGEAIAAFRGVLEGQSTAQIATYRERLIALVARLRRA